MLVAQNMYWLSSGQQKSKSTFSISNTNTQQATRRSTKYHVPQPQGDSNDVQVDKVK